MQIRTSAAATAVVAIVVLVTSACGVTEQAEGETTNTVEEATTGAEVNGEDAAGRAEAALVTAEDFPAGFQRTERAADGPDADEGGGDLEASCTPELENPEETVAQASSSAFISGDLDANDGAYFTADSAVFSSEEIAIGVVDRFGDDDFAACATQSIKEPFAPARAIGFLETGGDLDFGDQAAGLQGVLTITDPDDGRELVLDIGIIAIRTDDLVTVLSSVAAGTTLDPDLVVHLADTIVERQEG